MRIRFLQAALTSVLFLLVVLVTSGCSASRPSETKWSTYYDEHYKFSIDYPADWKTKETPWIPGTESTEGSEEGGIDVYVESLDDQRMFIYGQSSFVSLPDVTGMEEEKLQTNSGLTGNLSTVELDGKIQFDYIIDDHYIHAGGLLDKDLYHRHEQTIKDMLRSISLDQ